MKNLIVVGHHDITQSKYNKYLIDAVKTVANTEVHVLPNTYSINATKELDLLASADNIIFQFPLQWYNVPAVFKHYIDNIAYSILYGDYKTKIAGKKGFLVITAGAGSETYTATGFNKHTVEEFVNNINQLFTGFGITQLPSLVFTGATPDRKIEEMKDFANNYVKVLSSL